LAAGDVKHISGNIEISRPAQEEQQHSLRKEEMRSRRDALEHRTFKRAQ
jgi:hypothetical protein